MTEKTVQTRLESSSYGAGTSGLAQLQAFQSEQLWDRLLRKTGQLGWRMELHVADGTRWITWARQCTVICANGTKQTLDELTLTSVVQ